MVEDLAKLREAATWASSLALEELTTPEDLGESTMALATLLESRGVPSPEVVRGLLLGVARYSLARNIEPQGVGEILAQFIQWEEDSDE